MAGRPSMACERLVCPSTVSSVPAFTVMVRNVGEANEADHVGATARWSGMCRTLGLFCGHASA
jgi:hypothetical protein